MSFLRFTRAKLALLSLCFLPLAFGVVDAAACACGCQIFDTGFSGMPSIEYSNQLTLEYSLMDQNENQSGSALANPAINPDKQIETSFYTLSYSHDFDHTWGLDIEIPFFQRHFVTDNNGAPGPVGRGRGRFTGHRERPGEHPFGRQGRGDVHRLFRGHVHRPGLRGQAAHRPLPCQRPPGSGH